jgi:hypothetical protein
LRRIWLDDWLQHSQCNLEIDTHKETVTNFDLKQYQARSIEQFGERLLLFNIFRSVWPQLNKDFHVFTPADPGRNFEKFEDHEVVYKRKRIRFNATIERVDELDFIYIVPAPDGSLFSVEKINKKRH